MKNYHNDGSAQYATQNEFTAYLQTAVRRAKRRYLIRLRAVRHAEILSSGDLEFMPGQEDEATIGTPDFVDLVHMRHDLNLALDALPPRTRDIIRYKLMDDLTFREIAALLSLDESTVKSIYYRALQQLRWWYV